MAQLKLTREQLASFLPDHESIKQFEQAFEIVDAIAPDVVQEIGIDASNAIIQINLALSAISKIANALEYLELAQVQKVRREDVNIIPASESRALLNGSKYADFYARNLTVTSAISSGGVGVELQSNKDASGGYAGLTLYKINFKNAANTFTSFFTNANTAARTYTFQDVSGTVAHINTAQTFSGVQTFSSTIVGNISGNSATVTTNANLTGVITSSGNATSIASQTGTGIKFVVDTSPVLVTPNIGVATATTVNKMTITAPATASTLAVADGKTFTVARTLTLTGTDSTVMTFPTTSATIARTDAGNSFTGNQSATGYFQGSQLKVSSSTGTAETLIDMVTAWNNPSGNKSLLWQDATSPLGRISVDYAASAATMRFGSLYSSGYQTADILTLTHAGGAAIVGAISSTTTIKTGGYTVATLPAGTIGMRAYVTDALAPAFLTVVVGGGAVVAPVFYNGTNWIGG